MISLVIFIRNIPSNSKSIPIEMRVGTNAFLIAKNMQNKKSSKMRTEKWKYVLKTNILDVEVGLPEMRSSG